MYVYNMQTCNKYTNLEYTYNMQTWKHLLPKHQNMNHNIYNNIYKLSTQPVT